MFQRTSVVLEHHASDVSPRRTDGSQKMFGLRKGRVLGDAFLSLVSPSSALRHFTFSMYGWFPVSLSVAVVLLCDLRTHLSMCFFVTSARPRLQGKSA